MGLTIHWQWNTAFTRDRARELISQLYEYAATLGFDHSFEPVEIDWSQPPADEDEIFLRMHSHWTTHHEYEVEGVRESTGDLIEPAWSTCFFCTDPGTEPAFFGFGEYPATWQYRGKSLPTEASGRSWMNFCKTQYASMPEEGGEENFMQAHLRVVKVLDHAVRLGIPVEVVDDGEYWDTRDQAHLRAKVRQYNALVAGFAGHLKDRLGGDAVEAPIRAHPEFERLEAAGQSEFGQKFNDASNAVRETLETPKASEDQDDS